MAQYRAKRNMSFGGKLFDRGVCYPLNESELKNLGVDFELVEGVRPETPAKEHVEESKAAKAEPEAKTTETPAKEPQEQKAKRR